MIRVVLFLIAVALVALGAAWFADRPGEVAITWIGYRIETSVMVMAVAVIAVVATTILLWSLLRALVRSPGRFANFLRRRRSAQAYVAITQGLIAIGSGDVQAARKFAGQARRLKGQEPLALLLSAQSAQLSGDRSAAEQTFRHMAEREDTRLLGLRGLFMEAERRGDMDAARGFAERAATAAPALAWAAQAVLDFRCADRDWTGALGALDNAMASGLINKANYRRRRAVLLTARALSRDEVDREAAKGLVIEAVKLCPELVPAAALAGRLLAEDGETRKAGRVIEAAWRVNPHPDLAEAYARLRPGDSARDRLSRVQQLARASNDAESALAVARAAIDAREFAVARSALEPLLGAPTGRVALLMAEIEEADTGDVGRAREWMARAVHAARDPAWTADGLVSEKWMPVSPVTGRLDAFQWKVPLADLAAPSRLIDEARPAEPRVVAELPPAEKSTPAATASGEPVVTAPRRATSAPPVERRLQTVIAEVPVPDDPGPDGGSEFEPAPAPRETWWRLRS